MAPITIQDVRVILTQPETQRLVIVKVITSEPGLYGVGCATFTQRFHAVAAAIEKHLKPFLIGRDVSRIEEIFRMSMVHGYWRNGPVLNNAISGVDQALWDIKGKQAGMPVYQLLGGKCRERIRVYQNPGGRTPEETADNALKLIEQYGFTAIKTNPLPSKHFEMAWPQVLREVDRKMALLRDRLGDGIEIALDPHAQILEPVKAIDVCQVVAPYHPLFVEEPLRPENVDAMAAVRTKSPVPIATGEMLYTKWEFRDLLKVRGADIIQPDVCCCGGLTELKKIAALAEAEYVSVAPHNPMGPVATAVNAQFDATATTFLIQEYHVDTDGPRRDLVLEPYKLVDGYLELPNKPGLGIDLNEDYVAKHPYEPWKRGFPLKPDGAMGLI